jgi:hypothetical protein
VLTGTAMPCAATARLAPSLLLTKPALTYSMVRWRSCRHSRAQLAPVGVGRAAAGAVVADAGAHLVDAELAVAPSWMARTEEPPSRRSCAQIRPA